MLTDYITPGVIITVLILFTISVWMLVSKLWKISIVDSLVVREKVFKYFSDLGLYLVSSRNNKTKALYFKSYMALLLVMKPEIQNEIEEYNRLVIENIDTVSREAINKSTIKLINSFRKAYKIDKQITKIWIADIDKNKILAKE